MSTVEQNFPKLVQTKRAQHAKEQAIRRKRNRKIKQAVDTLEMLRPAAVHFEQTIIRMAQRVLHSKLNGIRPKKHSGA